MSYNYETYFNKQLLWKYETERQRSFGSLLNSMYNGLSLKVFNQSCSVLKMERLPLKDPNETRLSNVLDLAEHVLIHTFIRNTV